MIPFNELPMGARFKYPDGGVWVMLEAYGGGISPRGLISKVLPVGAPRSDQNLCCFADCPSMKEENAKNGDIHYEMTTLVEAVA